MMLRANAEAAINIADENGDEHATIEVNVLRELLSRCLARGEALDPFAIVADALSHQRADTDAERLTVTCGDLRAARAARPRL